MCSYRDATVWDRTVFLNTAPLGSLPCMPHSLYYTVARPDDWPIISIMCVEADNIQDLQVSGPRETLQ